MPSSGSPGVATTMALVVSYGVLYSVQNMMSPNLTMMAAEFGFTPQERDLYLGAYLNVAFMVVGLPFGSFFGYLADTHNRKSLYTTLCFMGAVAALMTAFHANSYSTLFFWRAVSGVAVTGAIPVIFSLLADWYAPDRRPGASAGLSAAMGGGVIIGQITAGFVGPQFGWRAPFVLAAVPGFIGAYFVNIHLREPARGAKEAELSDLLKKGASYNKKLTVADVFRALRVKTNILLLLQAFPGTIPWGVIFVYLNDFLAQEKMMSVQQATTLVGVFGVGSAVGGIGGGIIGARLYKKSKYLMPLLMGGSTALSVLPMIYIINGDLQNQHLVITVFFTFLAGVLPNINGSCVRPLLLNVNLPETRGTMIGAMTFVANLGRGFGPWIAATIMETMGGRQGAMKAVIYSWVVCGVFLLAMAATVTEDVKRMQASMRMAANEIATP